jgi:hypothetical protein
MPIGPATAVGGNGGAADESLDESCRSQVAACWTEVDDCRDDIDICDTVQERCRAMEYSCRGQQEVCTYGYLYVTPDDQEDDVFDQAKNICESLAGEQEPSGGSVTRHDDGVSYSCCWLVAVTDSDAPGAAGAGNP